MLNVIYGENASGKTKALEDLVFACDSSQIATNVVPIVIQIPYDMERVHFIEKCFGYLEFNTTNINRLIEVESELSDELLNILTILCRDVNNIFIDEPEFGIYGSELYILYNIFSLLSEKVENIWIVTHEDLYTHFDNGNVRYYEVLSDGDNFKLKERHDRLRGDKSSHQI